MSADDLTGAPQAVLDAALPPLEVPALQVTYHFVSGYRHTVTAPAAAFVDDGHGIETIMHNGLITIVCKPHVAIIETRHVTLKIKQQKVGQK